MDDLVPDESRGSAEKEHEQLLAFVADRDEKCPACGYNLRMLSQPTCPECGLMLKLTVGSNEPFKRVWAIALGLNAMIAGVGLFFLLIAIGTGDVPLYENSAYIWFLGPIIWIPIPAILFFARRWFCKLQTNYQVLSICITLFAMVLIALTFLSEFA